jgi:hypothetical protein
MAADDAFPTSYKDPLYASLDAGTEAKYKLPPGLLPAIRTRGERTNHGVTSSAGAYTPYQITKKTRNLILDKWNLDPYLSPQNASEAAGLLLKDSLDRNSGDVKQAVGEYVGGVDRSNWGPVTKAYVQRVTGSALPVSTDLPKSIPQGQSTFDQAMAATRPDPSKSIAGVLSAYQAGQMSPEDAKAFEDEINAGRIQLPRGQSLAKQGDAPAAAPAGLDGVIAAYQSGKMSPEDKTDFEALVKSGAVKLPQASDQIPRGNDVAPAPDGSQLVADPNASLGDQVVGGLEAGASALTGTVLGAPAAAAGTAGGLINSVLNHTFGTPEGANAIEQSASNAANAVTYAPRTNIGQVRTQQLGEGMQALLPVGPLAGEMAALGRGAAPAKQMVGDRMRALGGAEEASRAAVPPVDPAAPPVSPAATAAPLSAADLAQTAKTAAEGSFGSKKAMTDLAEQAAPNPKTVDAAKRLGIEDYLQPDHVTTNQGYRELAQALKSVPGSEGRTAELAGYEAVAKRADTLIDELGGASPSQIEANVKDRVSALRDKMDGQAEALYGQVRDAVPNSAPVEAPSTTSLLKSTASDLGGVERLSPVERSLLKTLTPGEDQKPVTYALLDRTRKEIGQALQKASGPFKDSETGLLKRLYSGLSADQEKVAADHGAYYQYQAAKYATILKKGFEDDLTSLFGKNLDRSFVGDLSGAVTALPKGDTAKMVKLLGAIPPDMRQNVVASGLATAFGVNARNGSINFTSYAKWYEGLLRNKQAHAAVMSNLPLSARKQLSDLYRVSSGISAASKERITTGRIQAVNDAFKVDGLVARIYEGAKHNIVSAAAGTAAGFVGGPGIGAAVASALSKGPKTSAMRAADALVVSPEFLKMARETAAKGKAAPDTAAAVELAHSQAFARYARALKLAPGLASRRQWVLQALKQPLPAPQTDTKRLK